MGVTDDDMAEVKEDQANQIVVINATLTRIEKWFGPLTGEMTVIDNEQPARAVLLLPVGLAYCPHCRRVRLPESMLADGHCQHCQH